MVVYVVEQKIWARVNIIRSHYKKIFSVLHKISVEGDAGPEKAPERFRDDDVRLH